MRSALLSAVCIILTAFTAIECKAQTAENTTLRYYTSAIPKSPFKQNIPGVKNELIPLFGTEALPVFTAMKRKKLAKEWLQKGVKDQLESILKDPNFSALLASSGRSWKKIEDIGWTKLLNEMRNSKITFKSKCFDQKRVEKEASTLIGVKNSEICIDLSKVLSPHRENWDEYWVKSKMTGLLFHEIIRHFSIEDEDQFYYEIIAAYAEYFLKHENIVPLKLTVPKLFAEWRKEFQYTSETLVSKTPIFYQCETTNRELNLPNEVEAFLLKSAELWARTGFYFSEEATSIGTFRFRSPLSLEKGNESLYPSQAILYSLSGRFSYLVSTMVVEYLGEKTSFSLDLRFNEKGVLLIEWSRLPSEKNPKFVTQRLPGAVVTKLDAFAYSRCIPTH